MTEMGYCRRLFVLFPLKFSGINCASMKGLDYENVREKKNRVCMWRITAVGRTTLA
jgi:hypothetical protein